MTEIASAPSRENTSVTSSSPIQPMARNRGRPPSPLWPGTTVAPSQSNNSEPAKSSPCVLILATRLGSSQTIFILIVYTILLDDCTRPMPNACGIAPGNGASVGFSASGSYVDRQRCKG